MSVSALQSKTMLQSISRKPVHHLELPAKHEQPKPQLPSKRKRDAICGLGAFNKPFTIHPSPESPYEKHYTFKPIRIIGRAQLPLTFLDTSNDEDSAATRLFIANIDILEKHHDAHNNENESPKVLIARYEAKKTLYAIERVQSRLYSICKLAPWLREKDVAELWDPASLLIYPTFAKQENDGVSTRNWWQEASVELDQVERPVKCVRLAMLRPRPQAEVVSTMPEPHPDDQAVHEGKDANPEPPIIPPEFGLQLPSPQEQLETLVQQYLDAVYLSKTSLAYLAKGPITRIRNTFTSHEEGAPPTHELVTFLRSMLLSHKARDKKYQAKLPEVIKAIPMGCFSDAEPAETVNKPKKSKKKVKLNREGMYPQEEEIVKKWWLSELPSGEGYGEETADQRIKRRTGDLRVREALAQMILMLEIIALESLSTYKPALDGNEEVGDESQAQAETQQPKTKKRKKKMEDINLLLDLLLDLLCIWQSTDEIGIIDFDAKPSKQNVATDGSGKGRGNDRLQSFCIEVIIPFYMSRLPEQALMINKKLGGPANTSPPKRKAMKPPTSRKQGESKEPELKKSRRTLARVATDTAGMAGERTRPSLNRNATDPALLNGIKREGSEVPLSAIPFQRSPSKGVRQTMSQFKHLKGREIDLTTTSAAAAAKMKQKKRVEEDLKEAISALKKPNRGLAVGGYVDDIERRGLGLSNKSRKPANPVRKVVKDVQVSATPRAARRTKDFIEQTPNHHHNPFSRTHESGAPPSDFLIPSSGVHSASSFIPDTVERGSTIRKSASHSVAETPSKVAIFKTVSPGAARRSIFETPSKDRPSTSLDKATIKASFIIDTPTKPSTFSPPSKFTDSPPGVFATPTKPAAAVADSPLALPTFSSTAKAKEDGEPSIYDALGWNDDDDLL